MTVTIGVLTARPAVPSVPSVYRALREQCRVLGIGTGPTAPELDIGALESSFGVVLPISLRRYFREVNGMELPDPDLVRFWSVAECRPLSEQGPYSAFQGAGQFFVVAEWGVMGWMYVVRLTPEKEPAPVWAIHEQEQVPVAASFRDFLAGYLRRDEAMLFPH